MDAPMFYTSFAEWSKILFYMVLAFLVFYGLYRKYYAQSPSWKNWIHLAVFLHFLVGALYSGIRMVTTDPYDHMMIRRFFAWEAWFNFACAAFYFLFIQYFGRHISKSIQGPDKNERREGAISTE
ncbi:MAG: hypothetical protein K9N46_04580 [Candidatus Marinimicrobia bacterium]|nr:hypothetical protein [Candidatus Neomarinimicrobiota bacterium]MCF7829337.1 hypothetical protein [Candidatus Neomarinimicrobiota bacterium]MCF7880001.1 hypothetical protein [Candidatus Neomarinimicrobiota bacterium]